MALRFFGLPTAHTTWSLDEDAVSVDRDTAPSGVPQATINGIGDGSVLGTKGKPLVADSTEYGRMELAVSSAAQSSGTWTVTANTILSKLNVTGNVKPVYQAGAATCITKFFDAAKVATADYTLQVDGALTAKRFTVPAGYDNVWTLLRKWLSANELDFCYVFNTFVVYPQRSRVIRVSDVSGDWTISIDGDGSEVKTINTYVYNRTPFTNGLVFPPHATAYVRSDKHFAPNEINAISVAANETTETEIELGAEVSALGQPTHVLSVPMSGGVANINTTTYPNGIYTVVGQDNKPITPAQWEAEGGSLRVELQPNGHTAKVFVTGMNNSRLGPFRIAESDGSTDHPSLYLIAASGQYVDIDMIRFDTGAVHGDDSMELDNPAIDTLTKAYRAAQAAADTRIGATVTLNWSGSDPVRSEFKDFAMSWAIKAPTLGDVSDFTGSPLPAKAEAIWPAGTTMSKIDSDLQNYMTSDATRSHRRQSFGRLAGSRFYLHGFWWRVSTASWSDSGVSITATLDQTVADLTRRYATMDKWDQPAGISLLELSTKGIL